MINPCNASTKELEMVRMSRNWKILPLICCVLLLLNGEPRLVSADLVFVAANNAPGTGGGRRFDSVLGLDGIINFMGDATTFVQSVFDYSKDGVPHKDVTKITFTLDDMGGVAYTTGSGTESEIHLSAPYVGNYSGDVVQEIKGVMYHEMTHVWQWNGKGSAPGGLIEGIADFVRLKANLAPSHWVKPGQGDKWDQGYDVTARFLDYCNDLKSGFVSELNVKLASGWSESFFTDLLGKSVQQLWNDYKQKYN